VKGLDPSNLKIPLIPFSRELKGINAVGSAAAFFYTERDKTGFQSCVWRNDSKSKAPV
jgi:hypothetical protein